MTVELPPLAPWPSSRGFRSAYCPCNGCRAASLGPLAKLPWLSLRLLAWTARSHRNLPFQARSNTWLSACECSKYLHQQRSSRLARAYWDTHFVASEDLTIITAGMPGGKRKQGHKHKNAKRSHREPGGYRARHKPRTAGPRQQRFPVALGEVARSTTAGGRRITLGETQRP